MQGLFRWIPTRTERKPWKWMRPRDSREMPAIHKRIIGLKMWMVKVDRPLGWFVRVDSPQALFVWKSGTIGLFRYRSLFFLYPRPCRTIMSGNSWLRPACFPDFRYRSIFGKKLRPWKFLNSSFTLTLPRKSCLLWDRNAFISLLVGRGSVQIELLCRILFRVICK